MFYELMHKDIPAAAVEIMGFSGSVVDVPEVFNENHLPPGVRSDFAAEDISEWMQSRAIPNGRRGLGGLMKALSVPSVRSLFAGSLALSLSDCYWIRPEGSSCDWAGVNFFDNPFSDAVGKILFRDRQTLELAAGAPQEIDRRSPDITTDGVQEKMWTIMDGERVLVKTETAAPYQPAYNEAIASRLMYRLGVPHVPYRCIFPVRPGPCSVCPAFTGGGSELVPAAYVLRLKKRDPWQNLYERYTGICENLGVKDIQLRLSMMIVTDYLMLNEDRQLGNFGLLHDPDSLEYIGAAPIYDTAASLGWNDPTTALDSIVHGESRPFASSHTEQLKFAGDLSWLDMAALDGFTDEAREILAAGGYIPPDRIDAVTALLDSRIRRLSKHIERRRCLDGGQRR